jgi:transcriptional regulator with XRE-family HTH domain
MKSIDFKRFMFEQKIKQYVLAQYLGVSEGYISQVANGKKQLSDENFGKGLNNPYGWDTSILTSDQPKNPAEEKPEDISMVDRLFALLQEEQASNKILLQLLREKEEKIEALQEELRAYREHKGETAQNAGNSSAASAV